MKNTVYCLALGEPQANEILLHLRNIGFRSSEISVLLKSKDTRNITLKEDAIRGAETGSLIGSLIGLTALAIPVIGPVVAVGPIVAALGGAAAGGVVGGLAGGSGAFASFGIPEEVAAELEKKIHGGGILIAVHSDSSARQDKALRIFKSSGADEIFTSEDRAA